MIETTSRTSTRRARTRGTASAARPGRPEPIPAEGRAVAARPPRRKASRVVLSAAVMTFAAGLVATLALPSYAYDPTTASPTTDVNGRLIKKVDGTQDFKPSKDVESADPLRDAFSATSSAELRRAAFHERFAAYTGPTAEDFLKNPAHPPFSLDAVFSTALQYQGVPYVFGGADPSGFDCSGFIMFVYAQYGVSLPHSVHGQDAIGAPIRPEDAQIGDVVIFNDNSHDGFYAGDGMILHAPYPGARVRIQPLWTSNVHFVRFGI